VEYTRKIDGKKRERETRGGMRRMKEERIGNKGRGHCKKGDEK